MFRQASPLHPTITAFKLELGLASDAELASWSGITAYKVVLGGGVRVYPTSGGVRIITLPTTLLLPGERRGRVVTEMTKIRV
jgi:hypothetical protein